MGIDRKVTSLEPKSLHVSLSREKLLEAGIVHVGGVQTCVDHFLALNSQ